LLLALTWKIQRGVEKLILIAQGHEKWVCIYATRRYVRLEVNDNSAKPVPRLIGSAVKNLCDSCFTLFNKGRSGGWDFTMKIIHYWAEELGPVPKLPNSISNPLNRAKLSHCLNEIINTAQKSISIEFPTFLSSGPTRIALFKR
jgi:hypothetical protein